MTEIKVNYKGTACRGTAFIYICSICQWEQKETHPAKDEPRILCPNCNTTMQKKPTVPSLDADHHDSMLSHNIGWDTE